MEEEINKKNEFEDEDFLIGSGNFNEPIDEDIIYRDYSEKEVNKEELDKNEEVLGEKTVTELSEADESVNIDEIPQEVDEINEIEKKDEKLVRYQSEIEQLSTYVKKLDELIQKNPRLVSRVESKPDFVVEVINSPSNQKIANLSEYEIDELLRRRRCKNFLDVFNWKITCSLIQKNIQDIENYSLSKDGFLIKLTLIEHLRHFSSSQQAEIKRRKVLGNRSDETF